MWSQIATFLLFLIVPLVLAEEEDEPFDIGLGTLSPSYSQTVGKDGKNIIKVHFRQKEDGVSYTITDPQSGTSSYYNFGGSGAAAAPAPAVMKELQAEQFTRTLRAPPPQPIYPQPQAFHHPPQAVAAPPPPPPPPAVYAQPPPVYAESLTAYGPPPLPLQYANPAGPRGFVPQQGAPVVMQYNSMHAAPPAAVPYAPQPVPFAPQPVPFAPQSVPFASQSVPFAPQPVPFAPQPAAVPIVPAMFSYHGIDGQRFAKNVDPSNFVVGPAPARGPAPHFFPFQLGPSLDMGVAQQPFFPRQGSLGLIPGGLQLPGGGFIAQGPFGYSQMLPTGVAQYAIQGRSHGGHTEEDLAARQKAN